MRTKLFWGMAGIALAILTAYSGCDSPVAQQPEIPAKRLDPLAVSAPAEVKAIAYEGLNVVTWTPVSNIVGYRVYRQDKSATAESLGVKPVELQWSEVNPTPIGYDSDANTALELYYVDIVSFTNQLVNDHEYVYYVESVSGASTAPGRSVTDYDPSLIADGSSLADAYLQNSALQASNTIKAIVPERDGNYDWIAVTNLNVVKNEVDGDKIIATWDAKPNLTYKATYTWGQGTATGIAPDKLGEIMDPTSSTVSVIEYSPFNSVGYASFPAAGGTNSITVYAVFAGKDAFFNKKASDTKPAVYALGLDKPNNFSADRVQDNSWVKLSWDAVVDASTYKVYRAEAIAGDLSGTPATYGSIKGDWALLVSGYDLGVAQVTSAGTTKNVYTLYDRGAALDKGYKYMLVAEGADSTRSLPATKDVSPNSSLNARPDDPDGFSAAWVNPTDVKISWDLPSGMLVSDIEYKLYRGAATFKNEQTGVIGNMTGYDYTTETAITVSLDNYTGAKLAVVDKPSSPTAPDGKVWVYRLVAVRYGYDSESVFAAIGLENAPSLSSANFSVAGHALDATQAFITWDVDEDLYDATFTLTRARILSPTADTEGTGSSGVLQLSDIESVGSYASVTIAQTDYLEGKAVVIDKASDLTTRSRWLYRLVAKKGNLASEPTYAILQDSAFVAATSVTLTDANTSSALNAAGSADPNLYQAANTQRIALGNLSGTYWGDNPAITLYRREASQPETAYEIVLNGTDPAFPVGNVQTAAGTPADSVVFTDPGLDYNKQYIYKVVVTNTGGTIRFKNSGGVSSSLTPTKTTVTLSAYSGGMSLSSNAIRLSAVGSSGGNAYLQGMKVKVRTKVHGTSQYTAAWQVLTVARGNESGSGTAADPNVYSYYVNITGLTGGIAYDIQYWSDGTSEPSGSANTINNLTAN